MDIFLPSSNVSSSRLSPPSEELSTSAPAIIFFPRYFAADSVSYDVYSDPPLSIFSIVRIPNCAISLLPSLLPSADDRLPRVAEVKRQLPSLCRVAAFYPDGCLPARTSGARDGSRTRNYRG